MSKRVLRLETDYFLVGPPANSIIGSKLPTAQAVLRYFFHIKDHCRSVCRVQEDYWQCAAVLGFGPRSYAASAYLRAKAAKVMDLFWGSRNGQKKA